MFLVRRYVYARKLNWYFTGVYIINRVITRLIVRTVRTALSYQPENCRLSDTKLALHSLSPDCLRAVAKSIKDPFSLTVMHRGRFVVSGTQKVAIRVCSFSGREICFHLNSLFML